MGGLAEPGFLMDHWVLQGIFLEHHEVIASARFTSGRNILLRESTGAFFMAIW